MDVGAFLSSIQTIDLVLFLFFIGFFVLGFAQGTIRRLIGIASILFSFLFAANVAEALGSFLGQNWTQFPVEYSYMIGFGTVFIAASLAFALIAQGFYKPQPLFENARFVDEIIGGILGVVEFGVILGATIIILDTFFQLQGIPASPNELLFLRDLWTALDSSAIVAVFRETIIPFFFVIFGFLIPDNIEAYYPRFGS
ncbi:MAG TPA: CvpA family protein [Candidatus Saccharimonadales bacterium]|nr:CvpA family protein [Candidatus Saccharimonadales bacterium]